MQVKQADILYQLDKTFISQLIASGSKSTYAEGTILFNQNDPAEQFFILLKGRVRVSIGDLPKTSYIVNHGGEAFGWSALTGRYVYSASATCISTSTLIAFDRYRIEKILDQHPKNAAMFYKNLALTLGNRLTQVSTHLGDHLADEDVITYGTGQVQEMAEFA